MKIFGKRTMVISISFFHTYTLSSLQVNTIGREGFKEPVSRNSPSPIGSCTKRKKSNVQVIS